MGAAMSAAPSEPRQRAVMATDSEWERVDAANAERVVERIKALAASGKAPPARGSGQDSNGRSEQGSLFC